MLIVTLTNIQKANMPMTSVEQEERTDSPKTNTKIYLH